MTQQLILLLCILYTSLASGIIKTRAVRRDRTSGTNERTFNPSTGTNLQGVHDFGGPVLKHTKVVPIYWNSAVPFISEYTTLYKYSLHKRTRWLRGLFQYGEISHGTVHSNFVDNQPVGAEPVTNEEIQEYLIYLILNKKVEQPDENTYYALHFPGDLVVTSGIGDSCTDWCAYHSSFIWAGRAIVYGVVPYCPMCGGSPLDAQLNSASHELVEAMTNPLVGNAPSVGPPLAWESLTAGEVADLCDNLPSCIVEVDDVPLSLAPFWSNCENSCICGSSHRKCPH
eukprot:TRINITY_DN3368_c0_g1_i1.p1 TRINITY_DN3368_c0_g1~~TRINITY_DN3368_c0_g1_i1.p1  ORF type:complete len:284 (+),score=-4.51 TRINITY_DN3368_c0_g1_i1:22-873(+)